MKYLPALLLAYPLAAGAQGSLPGSGGGAAAARQPLTEIWQLDSATAQRTFVLSTYRPFSVLPVRWSSSPNRLPSNSDPKFAGTESVLYQHVEAKLQFSVKTKVLDGLFGGRGDVWLSYTQLGFWQLYNRDLSVPFRELNYEPQLLFNYKFYPRQPGGLRLRMAGLAFVHQSNGLSLPLTRSWNRVVLHAGLQGERWTLLVRPWIPLNEVENPDIHKYIGFGDVTLGYSRGRNTVYAIAKSPLLLERPGRGGLQLNWICHLTGSFHGHLQLSRGYGDSLIDYNHRQTTVGLGFAFAGW